MIEQIIFFDGAPTVSKLNAIKIGKTVSEIVSNDNELNAVRVTKQLSSHVKLVIGEQ